MNSSVSKGCFTRAYYHRYYYCTHDKDPIVTSGGSGGPGDGNYSYCWATCTCPDCGASVGDEDYAEENSTYPVSSTESEAKHRYETLAPTLIDEWTYDSTASHIVNTVYTCSCGKLAGEVVGAYITY